MIRILKDVSVPDFNRAILINNEKGVGEMVVPINYLFIS